MILIFSCVYIRFINRILTAYYLIKYKLYLEIINYGGLCYWSISLLLVLSDYDCLTVLKLHIFNFGIFTRYFYSIQSVLPDNLTLKFRLWTQESVTPVIQVTKTRYFGQYISEKKNPKMHWYKKRFLICSKHRSLFLLTI